MFCIANEEVNFIFLFNQFKVRKIFTLHLQSKKEIQNVFELCITKQIEGRANNQSDLCIACAHYNIKYSPVRQIIISDDPLLCSVLQYLTLCVL